LPSANALASRNAHAKEQIEIIKNHVYKSVGETRDKMYKTERYSLARNINIIFKIPSVLWNYGTIPGKAHFAFLSGGHACLQNPLVNYVS
jgi:hypothetical protein